MANSKLSACLCWERTREAVSCSREHRAVVCAGESKKQKYQQQGQEKTGMNQQSLSADFSEFWMRCLTNAFYLKGQQCKIWLFNIILSLFLKKKNSRAKDFQAYSAFLLAVWRRTTAFCCEMHLRCNWFPSTFIS